MSWLVAHPRIFRLFQGAQYKSTIIFLSFEISNVNSKGEVRT